MGFVIRTRPANKVLLLVCVLAGSAAISGCDTFGGQDRLITVSGRVTFDFAFEGSSVTVGELNDIVSTAAQSVESILRERGFSFADLRGARIRTASVEIRFPVTPERMAFAERVVVKLRAPGANDLEVASGSNFSNQQVASLTPIMGQNILPIIQGQSFRAVMQLQPALIQEDRDYQMHVMLDVELDVEGF